MKFPCKKCGLCCLNISEIKQLADFNNGTGVCVHLTEDSLCGIYNNRPIWCNVGELYEAMFKDKVTEEEWNTANSNVCVLLSQTGFN